MNPTNLNEIVSSFLEQQGAARLNKAGNLDALKAKLMRLTPLDFVESWRDLHEDDRPVVFRLLVKNVATVVFDMLEPFEQGELIQSLTGEQTAALFAELDPDDRVHLLDEVPARVAKRLMDMLDPKQRETTNQLLGYKDGSVGRMMNPNFVDVKAEMTAQEALNRVRAKAKTDQVITQVYVTDSSRKLKGVLPLSRLVQAESAIQVSELLPGYGFTAVATAERDERAARLLQDADATELPVVDREGRLVGVFSSDDAMDVLREENTDDLFDKVGLLDINKRETDRSHKLLFGGFLHVLAVRAPFLIITLIGGMLAGVVIDQFEDVLAAVVATAIFIPVIMDMGGNVGTQSSTIFTRGMVLGQINMSSFVKQWLHEVKNGFGMAVLLGTLGGVIAGVWQGIPELGIAVGLSLVLVITLGVMLGFIVPFVLIKLGFDQAAGADPIITTIKDMAGLVIYFFLVSWLMPDLIAEGLEEANVVAQSATALLSN